MTLVVTTVLAHPWTKQRLYADGGDRLAID